MGGSLFSKTALQAIFSCRPQLRVHGSDGIVADADAGRVVSVLELQDGLFGLVWFSGEDFILWREYFVRQPLERDQRRHQRGTDYFAPVE
jgi:hypothetical protein